MSQTRLSYPSHQPRSASIAGDRELINSARNVMRAQTLVSMISQHVERCDREVLVQGNWRVRPELQDQFGDRVITRSSELFLLADCDRVEFEERRAAAARSSAGGSAMSPMCPLATAKDRLYASYQAFAHCLEPHTGQRVEDLRKEVNGALWFEAYIALNLDWVAPLVIDHDGGMAGVNIH